MMREKFHLAWAWVQAILGEDPERRVTLDPSTTSAMVYDRFKRLVVPEFNGKPGVVIERTGRMIRIRIDDKVCLRFKRLDRRLRSGNVKTKRQKAIYFNAPYLFDVADRATAVTFGYVPGLGEDVRGLYLTCPKNFGQNHWMIVVDDQTDAMPLISGDPLPPTLPTPAITPIIKPGETEKS